MIPPSYEAICRGFKQFHENVIIWMQSLDTRWCGVNLASDIRKSFRKVDQDIQGTIILNEQCQQPFESYQEGGGGHAKGRRGHRYGCGDEPMSWGG